MPKRATAIQARGWSVFDQFVAPSSPKSSSLPSWSVFDGFERPKARVSWQLLEEFVAHGRSFAAERCKAFPALLEEWDRLLKVHDGDPSRADWSHFRPLRVEREEDWSDWLQHFIATSASGAFSKALFGHSGLVDQHVCIRPSVSREEVTDDRRADLVITWSNGERAHVEVKVGDQSFAKTHQTAAKLEHTIGGKTWSHYILLPAEDVPRWDAIEHPASPTVHVITWDDVAVALRRALRGTTETRQWCSWAHGFSGLVEQLLLGHARADAAVHSLSRMARRIHQISIMKKGLEDV